jgi:hypothetical protein
MFYQAKLIRSNVINFNRKIKRISLIIINIIFLSKINPQPNKANINNIRKMCTWTCKTYKCNKIIKWPVKWVILKNNMLLIVLKKQLCKKMNILKWKNRL